MSTHNGWEKLDPYYDETMSAGANAFGHIIDMHTHAMEDTYAELTKGNDHGTCEITSILGTLRVEFYPTTSTTPQHFRWTLNNESKTENEIEDALRRAFAEDFNRKRKNAEHQEHRYKT